MKKILAQIYKKEQFNPSFIGLFTNPFYFSRRGLFKNVSELIPKLGGKLLDVGCGSKPYKYLCTFDTYIGLELDTVENRENKNADIFYDGDNMPFENNQIDSVLFNQVLEHVPNPEDMLKEINRVLKIDGQLLLTVPFVWDEHEQPYDFTRYSSFGIKNILNKTGYEVVEYQKTVSDFGFIVQLFTAYLYKIFLTKSKAINILVSVIIISPFTIVGLLLSWILPSNKDLFLDNVVLCKKVKNVK